jgi:hypothetical protein
LRLIPRQKRASLANGRGRSGHGISPRFASGRNTRHSIRGTSSRNRSALSYADANGAGRDASRGLSRSDVYAAKAHDEPPPTIVIFPCCKDAYAAHCTLLRLRRILSPIFAFPARAASTSPAFPANTPPRSARWRGADVASTGSRAPLRPDRPAAR